MCGEKKFTFDAGKLIPGSPPHVRGKVVPVQRAVGIDGITPACAGKRRWRAASRSCPWDHPRMCGEKKLLQLFSSKGLGSPPHVRGKVTSGPRGPGGSGITPACAGKREVKAAEAWLNRDHPRMCGEKRGSRRRASRASGSPPHVRGKDLVLELVGEDRGITPACAGKRSIFSVGVVFVWDHPRMCGEKWEMDSLESGKGGSPPHVRGKVQGPRRHASRQGITPACAGKSLPQSRPELSGWDHPRMCGEKCLRPVVLAGPLGSPPHVRGKVNLSQKPMRGGRITPACAGKREKSS